MRGATKPHCICDYAEVWLLGTVLLGSGGGRAAETEDEA